MTSHPRNTNHHPTQPSSWPRSYLKRKVPITRSQRRAIQALWPLYGMTFQHNTLLDFPAAFQRDAPTLCEVGFGLGDTLIHAARLLPDWNIFGIEMHRPGIGAALQKIHDAQLSNVRVLRGDALRVFHNHLPQACFQRLCIFFPEPWPRPKDHPRRILQPSTLPTFARALAPNAPLYIATDSPPYASSIRQNLLDSDLFRLHPNPPRSPLRPLTLYETRALAREASIFDLRAHRI